MAKSKQSSSTGLQFPSGDLSLDEARRRYDEEERRRENIETKIRLVLTANTIFISLGVLILEPSQALTAIAPSIISTIFGLGIIFPQAYNSPIGEDLLYKYAKKKPSTFHDDALLSYLVAIGRNKTINELKMGFLKITIYLSSSTLGLIFLSYWADSGMLFQFTIFVAPSIYSRPIYSFSEGVYSTIKVM